MSYPAFPSIQKPSYASDNKDMYPDFDKVVVKSEAHGYAQQWPRYTRIIVGRKWQWLSMPDADYQTLKNFLTTTINLAGGFVWTDPISGATSNQKLVASPDATQDKFGRWKVTLHMEEI